MHATTKTPESTGRRARNRVAEEQAVVHGGEDIVASVVEGQATTVIPGVKREGRRVVGDDGVRNPNPRAGDEVGSASHVSEVVSQNGIHQAQRSTA